MCARAAEASAPTVQESAIGEPAASAATVEDASASAATVNDAAANDADAAVAARPRADSSMMASPCEVAFFHMLRVELKKASEFYENTVRQMELRRKRVHEGVRQLRTGPTIKASHDVRSHSFVVAACIKFYKELVLLENFSIMCARVRDRWRAVRAAAHDGVVVARGSLSPLSLLVSRARAFLCTCTGRTAASPRS